MVDVTLQIGDRRHTVACRDGEENRLHKLGVMLEQRWPAASRAAGVQGTERAMLITALMLADALDEAQHTPRSEPGPGDATLDRLADRLEAIAAALEQPASAS